MSEGQRSTLLAYLRRLGAAQMDRSDAELLERFAVQRDEAAFEALLRRHGSLVWNVCRRILTEEHAVEDAFQATFLVLVRKAQSVSKKASIRSWLHGVALRVALRARQQENLRRHREQETPIRPPDNPAEEASWQDVRPILDEEIQRLPEKYRLPIILCYLEGQTNDEAAKVLNCPRGTIATRLARARERLRLRLLRRGITLSAATLAALLSDNALSAAIPPLLVGQTVKVVLSGTASASITTLTEGVLHAMFVNKVKASLAVVLVLAALGSAGVGSYYLRAQQLLEEKEPLKRPEEAARDKKPGDMTKERFQKLLKQRRDMAEEVWKIRYERYSEGSNEPGMNSPVTLQFLSDALKHLLKAELELSKNKAERLEARKKYLKRAKEITNLTEAHYKVGRVSRAAFASALYEQLDAEIELEREKGR
ncbi:MAG TPA: sigma-70 family RNA polymerase sigma factor [Gemmataceae bacterium]|nr:sigma-70 family RNA polymerase sigma factor [Gemmataceae bacterium]